MRLHYIVYFLQHFFIIWTDIFVRAPEEGGGSEALLKFHMMQI